MRTWEDYKKYVKANDKVLREDIEDMEETAKVITAMCNKREKLGISQRELAAMCNVPQSTVARIETYKVSPSLDTLFKLMRPLGLRLSVK
ncbi:MAG: helix-turn-helix transcriptional regulator [Eubacteriales bacterium]|nr:helix-turn-helix transcriptional regulator [Eubacteriales bacterium]